MNYLVLNNGVEIPQLGIGGFAQGTEEIAEAIHIGYRLIDTASQYGNEEQVGQAIKISGVPREKVFLSTKLWTEDIRRRRTREAFFESLKRLDVTFVDMFLIHWPADGFVEAWLEMEKLYKEGYVRAIGVSNCNEVHLEQIKEVATVIPAVNQIESHPVFQNQKLIDLCREQGMQIQAWCPLGGTYGHVLENPVIVELAEMYRRTPAQIVLRWHMQRDIITFPKSSHTERMKSNYDIFSFQLSEDDMNRIKSLDTGRRIGADPERFDF